MKKLFFLAVVIALLAAFFASSHPDGLDFVAGQLGFAHQAVERPGLPYIVGVIGVLLMVGIFWGVGRILKIVFLLMIILAVPVLAARPLITDDFYTVPANQYELEFGYASTQNQTALANTANLSFKRGILPNFDFGVEVPYTSTPSGINDILLHAKYRFWELNENNGLTLRVDYKFNNGDFSQGLGSGDSDYWLMLIGSTMFGQTKTHLNIGHVNVGVNAGATNDNYIAYSFALEHPVWGESGDLVVEYVANNSLDPHPAFVQIGGRYVVFSGFKLDAGYSFGLNNNSIKNSLTTGVHWEF